MVFLKLSTLSPFITMGLNFIPFMSPFEKRQYSLVLQMWALQQIDGGWEPMVTTWTSYLNFQALIL